jgi:L-fuconolactonase
MIIDAHQHFWKLDLPFNYGWLHTQQNEPICRSYLPADLKTHLDACGIDKSVFVQTQHDVAENRWVLKLAEQNDFIAGVVGWVDLASEKCEDQLAEFKDHPKFVGIRHIVHDEPDDDFIVRPEILRGLKVLQKHKVPYDLLFFAKHLKHAVRLGQELPELPMVIDHLSKPKIKDHITAGWIDELKAAAKFPNMYCKLSGMVTEADWNQWKPADLKPYVEAALEAFGPERCMYGSDWPVCELAGTYEQVYNALIAVLGPISDSERAQILGGTAKKFYSLNV